MTELCFLMRLAGLFIVTYYAEGICASQQVKSSYQWHESSQYSRVIVNATQGIETRPKEWFSLDKLITDFAITNTSSIGHSQAVKDYEAVRRLLTSYGLAVGTYVSGVTVSREGDEKQWPWESVPAEWMPPTTRYVGTWPGIPTRKIIDVSVPATRHALHLGIYRLWKEHPAPVRFVDNAGVHRSTGLGQSWKAYCDNMREIRQMGEKMGSRQIFNLSLHVGSMSDRETKQLMRAVGDNGIALETPWHPNIRKDAALTEKAKNRYRQLLDSGMGIVKCYLLEVAIRMNLVA